MLKGHLPVLLVNTASRVFVLPSFRTDVLLSDSTPFVSLCMIAQVVEQISVYAGVSIPVRKIMKIVSPKRMNLSLWLFVLHFLVRGSTISNQIINLLFTSSGMTNNNRAKIMLCLYTCTLLRTKTYSSAYL